MRIQIASDLHHEFIQTGVAGSEALGLAEGVDAVVLAGDIHARTQIIGLYGDCEVPVLYVHGNHECYGSEYFALQHQLRTNLAGTSLHFLERDEFVVHGVRFLGCSLWTDYELRPQWRTVAMREAEIGMNDHRYIRYGALHEFAPRDAATEHEKCKTWLENRLSTPFDGRTVVVTHHAPHPQSIPAEYADDVLSASFASDLTSLVEQADVWIHGHIHSSADYRVGKCRVICNPRGYPRRCTANPAPVAFENIDFDPALVIDV
ncbi:metallophosphoesterase family protein [Paraburkholderia xenovorans]|uniref:metallophosphoesterase family protein n=1 Tax=Paraburkholderia xenovorans TaxID=36873 RepID=UPI0038B86D73